MLDKYKKCGIIIQARMSSNRFPGKMLTKIAGRPLVEYVYRRCSQSKIKNVLVATSDSVSDDSIYEYCDNIHIPVMRGDLDNVVKRYIQAARAQKMEYICRVCGDTPFVDTSLIELLLETLITRKLDYAAPDRNTCASGFYSETMTLDALEKVASATGDSEDLEHVTRYILNNRDKFLIKLIDAGLNPQFARGVRFTMDYPADLELVEGIASGLAGDYSFSSQDVLKMIKKIKGSRICAE